MSSAYQNAIESVLDRLGADAKQADILRIDPHKNGAVLVQVSSVQGPEWYSCSAQGVEQLQLAGDKKLPASETLGQLVQEEGATMLGWRPGKRATLRVGSGAHEKIVKGYRKGRSVEACTRYKIAELAAAGTCLVLPEVREHHPAQELIEMSLVPGSPMGLKLSLLDQFFRLGHGLRGFQTSTPQLPLDHHGREAEIVLLTRLAARVLELRGELPEGWSEAANELSANLSSARPSERVLIHRDLHDGQLLVGEDRIGLLDFDLLCLGEPALDVANLSAHLRLRALQGVPGATESIAEQLSVALLEGLDRSSEEGFMESLRFYQSTTFLRLALVYYLRPRWNGVVPSLVSLASRCIHEMASA